MEVRCVHGDHAVLLLEQLLELRRGLRGRGDLDHGDPGKPIAGRELWSRQDQQAAHARASGQSSSRRTISAWMPRALASPRRRRFRASVCFAAVNASGTSIGERVAA